MSYDRSKSYKWEESHKFELTGNEFGLILNTIRMYLNSEEAARFQLMSKSNEILEGLLSKGIEAGTIVEKEQPQKNTEAILEAVE